MVGNKVAVSLGTPRLTLYMVDIGYIASVVRCSRVQLEFDADKEKRQPQISLPEID